MECLHVLEHVLHAVHHSQHSLPHTHNVTLGDHYSGNVVDDIDGERQVMTTMIGPDAGPDQCLAEYQILLPSRIAKQVLPRRHCPEDCTSSAEKSIGVAVC